MFERFRAQYAPLRDPGTAGSAWDHASFAAVEGYGEFMAEFAGASFGDGLYRVHDAQTGPEALALVAEAFPEFAERVCPFGYDWLGRQLAIDSGRIHAGQPLVLLLEPGTGEALEIPLPFSALHEEELIEYADAALAAAFFRAWSESDQSGPLRRDQCVGYQVPLFLGGQDEVENLEISDVDVYWSICGQLRRGVLKLPSGTSVNQIARD
ncbi:T6SS immunity protein Tdi1 domain-containing protein [Cellulomonas sp. NPDC058312]|uniref:T6SS immunity protein Tdi1 domain-containing protein n=1 Tax=Cellulomonas sp. NPDC058312 TaxID=3346441 RepID=UPI0036E5B55B